jgi:hypothetical protein
MDKYGPDKLDHLIAVLESLQAALPGIHEQGRVAGLKEAAELLQRLDTGNLCFDEVAEAIRTRIIELEG